MVVSKTNNRLTNAARESLKATERWDTGDMAILDEYVSIKFITKFINLQ
jgi:hypothetical protein